MALDIEVRRSNIRAPTPQIGAILLILLCAVILAPYLYLSLERKLVGVTASSSFDTFQLKSFNRTRVNRNVIEFCSD
jgi:hypothetical protein